MSSLEKAIKKLAEFKTAQLTEDFFEDDVVDTTEDEVGSILGEASNKLSSLLKVAKYFNKAAQSYLDDYNDTWDDDAGGSKYYGGPHIGREEVSDEIEKAVVPDNIDLYEGPADEDEIPDEYKMEQVSEEDVDQIFGLDEEGAFSDDPLTGKKHRDLESDFTMLDEDFDEKSSEAPTEVQDFIRQMEKELAKDDDVDEEVEAVAHYKNKFTKKA